MTSDEIDKLEKKKKIEKQLGEHEKGLLFSFELKYTNDAIKIVKLLED